MVGDRRGAAAGRHALIEAAARAETVTDDAAGRAPLTEAQSGLWYAQALDPANPIFNTGQALTLRGPLDRIAFTRAVDAMVAEVDALALVFDDGAGGPWQRVDPARRPWLETIDLSCETDPEATAWAEMRRDMATPIDPAEGPVASERLYVLGADAHIWYQRIHHLATDAYGMVLTTNRVVELYTGAEDRPLRPYATAIAEDAAYRASLKRTADATYWAEQMAGLGDIAGMAPGRAMTAHACHRDERTLVPNIGAGLRALAERAKVGWPDAIAALVAAYARRIAGADEIVVGVPHMGRLGTPLVRVPAMAMNILPLRLTPDEDAPLADYLASATQAMARARRHGRYRSEQLRRDLGRVGGTRRLYGALVNLLPFDKPPAVPGLDVTLDVLGTGPVDDISFTFRGDAVSQLTLEVEANPNLYTAGEAAAHGARLAAFLDSATRADTLGAVPTATEEEAARELALAEGPVRALPETTLTALIEAAMHQSPERPALVFGDETLSYAELDRRSAALAGILRARGAGADAIVAVALPRSIALVVALVAVLRAGAAYLPLDLDHPPQRIATILGSANPVVVLAEAGFADNVFPPDAWPTAPAGALPAPRPDDAAYVIYTSGSTGAPKGVVVEHRAIVNRLLWMQAHYAIAAHDRILQKTPATFDVSVWEFFLPLIAGATLVVAPPGAHRDPAAIAGLIRAHGITTLHFVPSMLALFLDTPDARGLAVARVFCSGEELPADLRDRFHATLTAELHNLYGPTEAAVDVSWWPAGPDDAARPVPIGWPVWNTRLLLLDERIRPVPPGMVGRLHLGGVQLARGYLGRADLTAERFLPDPLRPGERLYHSGDLARRREDGAVLFLGRADHQVKIRGFRIELGEIEAAIAASRLAGAQAVIDREDRAGERRLVAYVVPADGYDEVALRAVLAERLPGYMVPAAFVTLERLPVTANGKLDRAALPAPDFASAGSALPETETERTVAGLFAEILGLPAPAGRDDDFFALGGDSLSAVRLMLALEDRIGRDPGLGALFEHPTVADLAQRIDAGADDDALGPVVTLATGDPALPPLFLVHPAGGIAWGYRGLARALRPQRTVYGIQASALDLAVSPPAGIAAIAEDYAARMIALSPDGPYHVAGWSVGGIIAQAVAVALRDRGKAVGLVAMLDSYPCECWRAEPEPDAVQALRALLAIAGYDPGEHPDLVTREGIVAFLRAGDSPVGNLPPAALDGVVRVVLDTNRLVRAHHHRRYDGTLTHVRAAADHLDGKLTPGLWAPHAAALDRIDVPFLHPQLTGPAATALIAPALSERMA